MLRLGMLDFDTSHSVEFVRRLNHIGIDEVQWVEGARVVVACPGQSRVAPERIPGFSEEIRELGVPLVEKPTDMIGQVDGMLIESLAGDAHLERARPFIEAGIPCFIDKPFTCSTSEASQLLELADRHRVPIFSSSSLRYAPELVAYMEDDSAGPIHGAVSYGPAHQFDGNPGLFHYAIHAVEILYTLMGVGCLRVWCVSRDGVDVVTGEWSGGRLGTVRGLRAGEARFGAMVFRETSLDVVPIDIEFIYRELLKRVVKMFQTGQRPLSPEVTLELIAFIEAANASASRSGVPHAVVVQ